MVTIELFNDFFSEEDRIPYPTDPKFWTCRTTDFFEMLLGMGLCIDGTLIEEYIVNHWDELSHNPNWTGFSYGDSENVLDCDRWFVFCVPAPNSTEPIYVMVWQVINWGDGEIYFPDQIPVRVCREGDKWVPTK